MDDSALLDPEVWARFLVGLAWIVLVPGFVAVGWKVRARGALVVLYSSFATGALIAPIAVEVSRWLPVPLNPVSYSAVAILFALVTHRLVERPRQHPDLGPPLSARSALTLAGIGAVFLAFLLVVYRDFPAPPHWHDATNHAFLVKRIADAGSTTQEAIFGPFGIPGFLYQPTWHVVPAMTSNLAGGAAWLHMWGLVLLCLAGSVVGLGLLWKSWEFSDAAVLVAAALLLANQSAPAGILGWGGFTTVVGLFLTPAVLAAVTWARSRPSYRSATLCGLGLGSLTLIQPGFALLALVCGVARGRGTFLRRSTWWWGLVVVAFLVVVARVGLEAASDYVSNRLAEDEGIRFGRAVNDWFNTLGRWDLLKVVLAVGVYLGFREARFRWLAWVSTGLGLLMLTLGWLADPVSRALTAPWYSETLRVRYALVTLLTPLAGYATVWIGGRFRPRLRPALIALLVVVLVAPGVRLTYRSLRSSVSNVGITAGNLRLVDAFVPEGRVLNSWDDGSPWLAHSAEIDLLLPCAWEFWNPTLDVRGAIAGLTQDPWPAATRKMRELDIHVVFASRHSRALPLSAIETDSRFEKLRGSEDGAFFRLRWEP